ncbi:hypothetical protein ACFLYO_08350, partial [Chloroflexota bacterium]
MDEALELLRNVPNTLNNRALLLSALASLPGQDRAALLQQALQAYDEALELRRDVPLDYAMTQGDLGNLYNEMEDYDQALQAMWAASQGFEIVGHTVYIEQIRCILVQFKKERSADFDTLWAENLDIPQPDWLQSAQVIDQRLVELLVAWLQTPNWATSEAFLRDHEADLLTDEAAAALQLLLQANPGNTNIEQHIQLLGQAREQDIEAAYAEIRAGNADP